MIKLSYSVFNTQTGRLKKSESLITEQWETEAPQIPQAEENELVFTEYFSNNYCLNQENVPTLMPEPPPKISGIRYTFNTNTWTWQDAATLEQLKTRKKNEINQERERRNELPIEYQNNTWDADPQSQRNVSAWMTTLAAGATLPAGFTWRSYNNQDVPADQSFVNGLGAAMTLRGTQIYQTSWVKKAEVDALTTVEQVNNYDVNMGW
jgi:hypothetical protein